MDERRATSMWDFLDGLRSRPLVAAAFLLILGIGYLDYATGDELSLYFFYLIPVCLVGAVASLRAVAAACLCSAAAWLAAFLLAGGRYTSSFILAWNSLMRLCVLGLVGYFVHELGKALRHQTELSTIDHLTGVANRRLFYERLREEIGRSRRYGYPFSLVYIDVDDFKAINDGHGHDVGDEALRRIAASIGSQIRSSDTVGRFGGDEFLVLLPGCDAAGARIAVEKIREAIRAAAPPALPGGLSVSCGAHTTQSPGSSEDELVKLVDGLMYRVKLKGKGSAAFSSSLAADPKAGTAR